MHNTRDKARYWSKIAIICRKLSNLAHCDRSLSFIPFYIRRCRYGGPRRNAALAFGFEKLEWCGYPMVKKV